MCTELQMCHRINFLSMLSQAFNIIIDKLVSAPAHGREVVDCLNTTEKRFIFRLMSTVQIPGAKGYNTQDLIHSEPSTADVILACEF